MQNAKENQQNLIISSKAEQHEGSANQKKWPNANIARVATIKVSYSDVQLQHVTSTFTTSPITQYECASTYSA